MQDLPQKSFERNMNHNYMVLSQRDFFATREKTEDYRVRMLLENKITGLLPVSHRVINGEDKYYYEINSLQSMDRIYEKSEVGYRQLKMLLEGCIRLSANLEEYLLDGAQVIWKPEYIYLHMESLEPYFVYYPEYAEDERQGFANLMEELLKKIDHTDEQAVMLAYQVYRYTRNQNYVVNEITRMIMETEGMSERAHEPIQEQNPDDYYQEENDWQEQADTQSGRLDMDSELIQKENSQTISAESAAGNREKPDLTGFIICLLIAFGAGGILVGAQGLGLYVLSEKQQLYLYGAASMSLTAGVIFLAGYFRKKRMKQEIEELQQEENVEEQLSYSHPVESSSIQQTAYVNQNDKYDMTEYGETVCLDNIQFRERYLTGQINGQQTKIVIDRLPMTIGKMTGWSDYCINDNTVSKMHARLEEKNGKIYIEDLNSTNGTVKNGKMLDINQPMALEAGDEIKIGRVYLTYWE